MKTRFLKEELRNKQLVVEKLLDRNSDKINVQKPSEQINMHKVNVTHRSNQTNKKKFDIYHKKSPKAPIRESTNRDNNVSEKRVTVIGDSMVKFSKSENLSMKTTSQISEQTPVALTRISQII